MPGTGKSVRKKTQGNIEPQKNVGREQKGNSGYVTKRNSSTHFQKEGGVDSISAPPREKKWNPQKVCS